MIIQDAIQRIIGGAGLSEDEAAAVAREIMAGRASAAQIGGLLVALRMRGESVDEIVGFVRAVRDGGTPIPLTGEDVIDTCGTGGDGRGTFNISTAVAFVAAAAGCRVAKHGNRSVSSRCGSADVLAELGVRIDLSPERTAACIDRVGVGFLMAPQYHPGARHAVEPRKQIGIRSIFNTIGPLVHPARARRQLIGVYAAELTETMAQVLHRLGSTHCLIVHGEDGMDEISITGPTRVTELLGGTIKTRRIAPEDMGFQRAEIDAIAGGDATANARVLRLVLAGGVGPRRDVVLLNAGAAIYVGGRAATFAAGVDRAIEAIDSGAALGKLDALIEFGRREGT